MGESDVGFSVVMLWGERWRRVLNASGALVPSTY